MTSLIELRIWRRLTRFRPIVDWSLIILPILLSLFGLAVLFSFQTRSALAVNQAVYLVGGLVVFLVASFTDYRNWRSGSWYLYGLGVGLLILVMIYGSTIYGAKRWIDLTIIQLQPSEIVKMAIIIITGHTLANLVDGERLVTRLVGLTFYVGLPVYLIARQPDLGTASVIIFTFLVLLTFVKFIPRRFWLAILVVGLVLAPIVYYQLRPYQQQRLKVFLRPQIDPSGGGYNVIQSVIAIGSGGIWGRGLGQGSQSQLQFLPVVHSDFIFSAVAEAFGFLGASTLAALLFLLVVRAAAISSVAQDAFGQLIALGIALMWLYQGTVNIGMNLGLAPVTGIPLPFVSYGGTAIITNYLAAGLLQSIYIRHKKIRF